MPRTTKLNDLQLLLLAHAAKMDAGHVFPLPACVTDQPRAEKDVKALLSRGLVGEAETLDRASSWRSTDHVHFGLTITSKGLAAICVGNETGEDQADALAQLEATQPAATRSKPRAESKIAGVLALLKRVDGATLAQMVESTGWQPHTTRAALTALRKKGHVITKSERDGRTCYRIGEAA